MVDVEYCSARDESGLPFLTAEAVDDQGGQVGAPGCTAGLWQGGAEAWLSCSCLIQAPGPGSFSAKHTSVQMGAAQRERLTHAPPVLGQWFLGSFSGGRGVRFWQLAFPCCCGSGCPSVVPSWTICSCHLAGCR